MNRLSRLASCAALVLAVVRPASAQSVADSGTFLIRHAGATVATEDFQRTPTTLAGTLHLKNSRNTFQRYSLVVAPDASVPMVEVTVREDADSGRFKAKLVQRSRVIFREDSAAVDAVIGQRVETLVLGTSPGAMPYLNMSFAMLEQAVRRSRADGTTAEVPFFNLGGGQTVSGKLSPVGSDSLNLAIGDVIFHLRVDPEGRILGGTIPSQDVRVERQ